MFALGPINEAIAEAIPDHEAIISSTRRLTWRDFQLRSRRLANLLHQAGLGCHRERDQLEPWESGQDHVAYTCTTGTSTSRSMIGCYKARVAPFNVNYRYVEEELRYLLADAKTKGIIYHASFAPRLATVLRSCRRWRCCCRSTTAAASRCCPGRATTRQRWPRRAMRRRR